MNQTTNLPTAYYIWKNSQGKICTQIEKSSVSTTYTRYAIKESDQNSQNQNDGKHENNNENKNSTMGNLIPNGEKQNEAQNTIKPAAKGTFLTIEAGQAQFKVTSPDPKDPTVEYAGLTTSSKKKKTVSIPEYVSYNGVKYRVTSVAAKCFKNNKKLNTVKIAGSITKIGNSAFEGCSNLKTVTVGKGLKAIGKNVFKNCKSLKKITLKSTKLKTVGKTTLKGVNAKCRIKVPAKKVKAYQKLFKGKGQKASVKIIK